jgi:heat-inducible transcriptional repressor
VKRKGRARVAAAEASDLDAREEAILRSIIHEHILTGEPIGSHTLSRGRRLDLSPATIRNIMSALEDRGLLTQPHVSAGRLPTAKAYRLYVDRMIGKPNLRPGQARAIDRALAASRGEIAELLGAASQQLSRFSQQVGIVLAPEIDRIVVEHLEFVRIDRQRVVAILVGRSGLVHNRILTVDEPLEQADLDRIGRYLSGEFGGQTLPEIRRVLRERMSEERAAYDRLVARSLELGRQTVDAGSAAEVFVDGTSNLLGSPEFADPEKIRSLMQALERKRTLIDLLGRCLEEEGVHVVIGEEGAAPGLADCSVVAASYTGQGGVMGTLGVVGPRRMEYAQAVALVDYLAHVLGRFFGPGEEN